MKKILKECIIFSLFIGVIIMLIIIQLSYGDKTTIKERSSSEIIITEREDKFKIDYIFITDFPDVIFDIEVYNVIEGESNLLLVEESIRDKFLAERKINLIFCDNRATLYRYSDFYLLKWNDSGDFKVYNLHDIEKLNPDKHELLVYALKKTITYDWIDIRYYGKFLLKAKDKEMYELVSQYADGIFINEQIEEDVKHIYYYSAEERQEYCQKLLELSSEKK